MLTAAQIRAARGLLGWPARVLAERAGVSLATVQRLEHFDQSPHGTVATAEKIRHALEAAGIEFEEENGVRLNTPPPSRSGA